MIKIYLAINNSYYLFVIDNIQYVCLRSDFNLYNKNKKIYLSFILKKIHYDCFDFFTKEINLNYFKEFFGLSKIDYLELIMNNKIFLKLNYNRYLRLLKYNNIKNDII